MGKIPVYCYPYVARGAVPGFAPALATAAGALMVMGQALMKAVLIVQAGQLRPIPLPAERLLGRPS